MKGRARRNETGLNGEKWPSGGETCIRMGQRLLFLWLLTADAGRRLSVNFPIHCAGATIVAQQLS
jgi:hypothetical protein